MKAKLEHGADIEFVTPGELVDILDQRDRMRALGGPQRQWPFNAVTLDSSGNGACDVYTVPVDRNFILHRLAITADGYTVAAPFVNAAGWLEVHHNGQMIDFFSLAPGIPAVGTWGTESGIHFAAREKVVVKFFGGPASSSVTVRAQGTLEPLPAAN